ncbi:MAG TPA: DUF4384 domain-containing protein [Candidatus Krumholzibacteria bacterium]|nr:DUF4384 domain-containing protein [Candidatus Krumholzibacteria bacterium]HRX51133.1 DUF4384 domain-containing protein [Candidatus Krumholzibacteria bacterium]
MDRRRTKSTTTLPSEGRGAAARVGVTLLLLASALLLGVVTARAQHATPDLDKAVADGWQGYEQQPLRVNVWHDRDDDEVYSRGESVRVHFETNGDAYVVIYRIDAEGEVSVLWPRSRYDDGFVFGHHTYSVPNAGAARLRAADVDGVEYVEALVSAYPFDLRGLDIDFHHEREETARAYYVAGDPYLAMNDVNFAITGLEDAETFVAASSTSWYVGRRVDHPRFLCGQCHEDQPEPYRDTCVVEIHHDYGWGNQWYRDYGYYPLYSYPVYYYVDPWTMRPWVNYWYRPWYAWPRYSYSWGFDCYVWNYSPYWSGDVWVRYKDGDRLHRPLGKADSYKRLADEGAAYRHPETLGKSPRPTQNMLAALNDRGPVSKGDRRTSEAQSGAAFRDVSRAKQPRADLGERSDKTPRTGIRVDRTRYPSTIGSGSAVRGDESRVRTTRTPTGGAATKDERVTRPDTRNRNDNTVVRPVEPRSKGSRIWQGGRSNSGSSGTGERAVKPAPRPDTSNGGSKTDRTRSSGSRSDGSSAETPRTRSTKETSSTVRSERTTSGSSRSGGSAVQPRSSSSGSGSASGSSSGSRSSSGSSSGSRSKGGSSKQR